jgi:hypothetical protein
LRSARSSAVEAAGSTAGDDGCEVERRFEAVKREEKRDWSAGPSPVVVGGIPLAEDGREWGSGPGEAEDLS